MITIIINIKKDQELYTLTTPGFRIFFELLGNKQLKYFLQRFSNECADK